MQKGAGMPFVHSRRTLVAVLLNCCCRMLLWHGSRLTNMVGILSSGLRVAPPEAPVTGYMVCLSSLCLSFIYLSVYVLVCGVFAPFSFWQIKVFTTVCLTVFCCCLPVRILSAYLCWCDNVKNEQLQLN